MSILFYKGGEFMEGPEFEFIYKNYVNKVYHFVLRLSCNRYVAEEITQETFVRAYSSIDNFEGRCKIEVWLCQIAKNLFFDYIKKKNYEIPFEINDYEKNHKPAGENVEDTVIARERLKEINKLAVHLKEPWRSVFIDHIFMGLDYKEIALKYKKNENWARVNFYRAKQRIKEWIDLEKERGGIT